MQERDRQSKALESGEKEFHIKPASNCTHPLLNFDKPSPVSFPFFLHSDQQDVAANVQCEASMSQTVSLLMSSKMRVSILAPISLTSGSISRHCRMDRDRSSSIIAGILEMSPAIFSHDEICSSMDLPALTVPSSGSSTSISQNLSWRLQLKLKHGDAGPRKDSEGGELPEVDGFSSSPVARTEERD